MNIKLIKCAELDDAELGIVEDAVHLLSPRGGLGHVARSWVDGGNLRGPLVSLDAAKLVEFADEALGRYRGYLEIVRSRHLVEFHQGNVDRLERLLAVARHLQTELTEVVTLTHGRGESS